MATLKRSTRTLSAQASKSSTAFTKFRLPQGRVLLFTPTGKAIPMSAQAIADSELMAEMLPNFEGPPQVRGILLAALREARP